MFNCTRCGYTCKSKQLLKRHTEVIHKDNIFKCEKCDYNTKVEQYFQIHIGRCQGENTLSCERCPYKVTNEVVGKQKMKDHIEIVHEGVRLTCHLCNVKLTRKSNLDKHMQEKHSTETFQCNLCNYLSSCKRNVTRHVRRVHDEKKFNCNICEFKAAFEWGITKHKSMCHQDHLSNIEALKLKKFKCQLCVYQAKQSNHLKIHMRVHDQGKEPLTIYPSMIRMKCKICGQEPSKAGFRKHLFLMHDIARRTADDDIVNTEKCSDCNTIPNTKRKYINHLYWMHSSEDIAKVYPSSSKKKSNKRSIESFQDPDELKNPSEDKDVDEDISEDEVPFGEYFENVDCGQIIKDESEEDVKCISNEVDEGKSKEYLCPISSCTFTLPGKNEMSEANHFRSNHPSVKKQLSFLLL